VREQLLAAIRTRIEQANQSGDERYLLGPEAVAEAEALLAIAPPTAGGGDVDDLEVLHAVGWLYWLRFQAVPGDPGQHDLRMAATLLDPVFAAGSAPVPEPLQEMYRELGRLPGRPDPPNSPAAGNRRAFVLLEQFQRTGDPGDLQAATKLFRAAVQAVPDGYPDKATAHSNLGNALRSIFMRTGNPAILAEATAMHRVAVEATPDGHPDQPGRLLNLGGDLCTLFEQTGDPAALSEAIALHRAALAVAPEDHPGRGALLSNLGAVLFMLFTTNGDLDELAEAIAVIRGSVAATPHDHANRAMYLSNLGNALCTSFERTGDLAALTEAITLHRAALAATRDGNPNRAMCLVNLGTALQRMFDRTGDPVALTEAVAVTRSALAAAPEGHPGRGAMLSDLGAALSTLFEQSGDLDELTEAIVMNRAAVAATPDGHPNRAKYLSNVGNALQRMFDQTGSLEALTEAIAAGRAVLGAAPEGHPERAVYLSNLGAALHTLFWRTGGLGVLTEAIAMHRAAVAAAPDDHPKQVEYLSSLGTDLHQLFEQTEDLEALTEAIAMHRAAVAAAPDGNSGQAGRLAGLGSALHSLFWRTGDPELLSEVIMVQRAAVAAAHDAHFEQSVRLSHLGIALTNMFEYSDDLEVLTEAIAVLRAALAATPEGHVGQAGRLTNLGAGLRVLFERTKQPEALAEAIATGRRAVALAPDDDPGHAALLSTLGAALHAEFERTGDLEALAQEQEVLGRAAASPVGPVRVRVRAARRREIADRAAGDDRAALAAMETAVGLLPLLAGRALRRADREHALGEVAGIGAQAAAAALSAGRPHRAVELLEQARGLLLAEAMDDRGAPARLLEQAPDLVADFEKLRERLAVLDAAGSDVPLPKAGKPKEGGWEFQQEARHHMADRRRQAAADWDALLARIRARPALADFLVPPTINQLRRHADHGPIVIVTTHTSRCDALILTGDSRNPVLHVPLPALTHEAVDAQANRFHSAQHVATSGSLASRQKAQRDLHEILAWLWDTAAEPILAALNYSDTPGPTSAWPRLWWCPVGIMAYLPLHAAGHHDEPLTDTPHPRTVLDRVVSSYTATIRSLAYTRRDRAAAAAETLIVAMPQTPGVAALPGVATETSSLMTLVPGATLLEGTGATHDTVLAALPAHSVAHFACHGLSDWADPAASHLLLHDHESRPLSVTAISRLHLASADLAYLSACSTTDASPRLADEAVHITAAFQLAGYRNVIGTLWPVNDQAATYIATDVYRHLTRHGAQPPDTADTALALHLATRRLRAENHAAPTQWAAHIHTGA
jgi:tetratricopeptide (TPR) repeat protein